jgi:hypothetical protein
MSIDFREAYKNKWMRIAICTLVCATLTAIYRHDRAQLAQASQLAGAYCDNGIGAAKAQTATVTSAIPAARITQTAWAPKINDRKPPVPVSSENSTRLFRPLPS